METSPGHPLLATLSAVIYNETRFSMVAWHELLPMLFDSHISRAYAPCRSLLSNHP